MNWLTKTISGFVSKAAQVVYGMIPTWRIGQPTYPAWNFNNNTVHGYRKNELIYTCLVIKATSALSAKIVLRDGKGDEIKDHPLLELLENPNPEMSQADFLALIVLHRDLAGVSYWQKLRSRAGQVVQLWPLRPDWMWPLPTPAGVMAYQYRIPGQEPIPIPAANVLAFRRFDPIEIYGGLAPVSVAGRVSSVDNDITDFIKSLLEQGGIPPGILTSKLKLQPEYVEDIRRGWRERYGGWRNWGEPAVLDSDAQFQRTGLTLDEMAFPVLNARDEARICMVLEVPPMIVGAQVGLDRSTFNNYEEARRMFWQDTLVPMYSHLISKLQAGLAIEYGEDLKLGMDYTDVPALSEDHGARWTRATGALTAGGITVNMFLEEIGKETIGEPGDVFLRPTSAEPVPKDETVDQQRQMAAEQQQAMFNMQADATANKEPNKEDGDEQNSQSSDKPAKMPRSKKAALTQTRAEAARHKKEKALKARVESFLVNQQGRASELLEQDRTLDDPVFWAQEDESFFATIFNVVLGAAQSAARTAIEAIKELFDEQGEELVVDTAALDRAVYDWAKTYTYELVKGINHTTRAELQNKLSTWTLEGSGQLDSLIKAIEPTFGASRAEQIAITETTRAYTEGYVEAWRTTGKVRGYDVYTVGDNDVDEVCEEMSLNGPYDLNDQEHRPPFHVGCVLPGNEIVAPGNISAAAKSFYDGRCVEIATANGHRLTVTANHPILTSHGWINAQFLNQGDKVVSTINSERIFTTINPNNDYRPAVIEQIFSAIKESAQMFTASMPVTAEDFNGDGRLIDGNVEVVYVDGLLRSNGDAALNEPVTKYQFGYNGLTERTLSTNGGFNLLINTGDSTPSGGMSLIEHSASHSIVGVLPAQVHAVRDVAGLDSIVQKSPPKDTSINADLTREFLLRFASDIAIDEVIEIRDFNFTGHVYDLQVDDYELYICNGIITHNCRCGVQPVMES